MAIEIEMDDADVAAIRKARASIQSGLKVPMEELMKRLRALSRRRTRTE